MNGYLLLVFLHVLSAIGMFAAWGAEAVLVQRLQRAVTLDDARLSARQLRRYGRLAPIAMLVVLATGMAMATRWGPQPWMTAAFGAVLVVGAIGGVTGRRMGRRMAAALADETPGGPAVIAAAAGSLAVALQLRFAVGAGIIGLMTMKPGGEGSLVVLGVAALLGLATAARESRRRTPSRHERADEQALRAR